VKTLLTISLFCGATLTGTALCIGTWFGGASDPGAYTTVGVEFGRASETVTATGTVQAREVIPVGSDLSGKVVEVLADYNQVVREGDVLARLDQSAAKQHLKQAELAVEQARVAVKQAEASRDAAEKVADRERQRSPEVRRQPDMDVVESQLRTAEVAVEAAKVKVREAEEAQRQAEWELQLTTIRVPTLSASASQAQPRDGIGTLAPDGAASSKPRTFVVLERKVSLNQQIAPPASGSLFTLAGDLERMEVQAQVAEGDINKVVRGQRVDFTVSGNTDHEPTFTGKVKDVRLVPISDHGAVYYKVLIDVQNQRNADGDWHLRPGQTANVEIVRRVHDAVWKMPGSALNFQMDIAPSAAVQAKLQQWQDKADRALWRQVWVLNAEDKPWPIFVRLDNRAGEQAGIQETLASEVLEWDPELAPAPNPKDATTFPRVITSAPLSKSSGFFNATKIKF
jgi:HlyD family secretion protein